MSSSPSAPGAGEVVEAKVTSEAVHGRSELILQLQPLRPRRQIPQESCPNSMFSTKQSGYNSSVVSAARLHFPVFAPLSSVSLFFSTCFIKIVTFYQLGSCHHWFHEETNTNSNKNTCQCRHRPISAHVFVCSTELHLVSRDMVQTNNNPGRCPQAEILSVLLCSRAQVLFVVLVVAAALT